MVTGGHIVDSSMYKSYSSVVQIRTIRLLKTVAINEGLDIMTMVILAMLSSMPSPRKRFTLQSEKNLKIDKAANLS